MIDEIQIQDALNSVLKLSFEEKNTIYFKIKAKIENSSSNDAAKDILLHFIDLISDYKEKLETKLVTASDGTKNMGGIFRRVSS